MRWQDIKGSQVLVGNYEEAVKMMGETNFLSSLIRFPKETITDETVELLQPYFKAQDFNFESAMKVPAHPRSFDMGLRALRPGDLKSAGSR